MPNGCRTENGDCMGDEGKAVGIAQAPAALLSAHRHENNTWPDQAPVPFDGTHQSILSGTSAPREALRPSRLSLC
jgi:hypothetical protein